MPKVNIYEPLDGLPTDENRKDQRRIQVGWSKGNHAQIGIGWPDPDAKPAELVGNVDWAADFVVEGDTDNEGRVWRSQSVNLDRDTINRLIRELRAARDAAFGRDE